MSAPGLETSADRERIGKQREVVKAYMLWNTRIGCWVTLEDAQKEIQAKYGVYIPLPSLSARFRDLRKLRYGGYLVKRDYLGEGLYRYRLFEPEPQSTLFSKGEAQ
jgi:hypothetical protein